MFRFFKAFLKRMGILEPKINSFETAMLNWLDGFMRGDPEEQGDPFKDLLAAGTNPKDLNRELVIAYMFLLTRLAAKYYSTNAAYQKGMDQFHIEAYRWLVADADIEFNLAKPFEELLRIRYAEYDIAFSQKDNMGTHYFARTFIETLNNSLREDVMPLVKCTAAFGSFIKSTDELLKTTRDIYQEQSENRRH